MGGSGGNPEPRLEDREGMARYGVIFISKAFLCRPRVWGVCQERRLVGGNRDGFKASDSAVPWSACCCLDGASSLPSPHTVLIAK